MQRKPKYSRLLIPASIMLFLCIQISAAHAQISIVINKLNSEKLSESDLKNIFAGAKLTMSNGEKIQIADQSASKIGKEFYKTFLDKSVNQIRTQWTKLVLSGQAGAPIKCADDEEVKKAVARDKNTIGFISSSALDATVKEILKIK